MKRVYDLIRQYEHNTEYQGISSYLFDKLTDQELLYKLVLRCGGRGSKNAVYITKRACYNITDEKILERMAFDFHSGQLIVGSFGQSSRTHRVTLFNPVKNIADKSILANIANNCDDCDFRECARDKLKD